MSLRTVHVIITNEVQVNILQAHIFLQQHIRKGGLLRFIYCQQFRKEFRNVKRELCLNVIISFSIIVCCLVVTRSSKNSSLSKLKLGHN